MSWWTYVISRLKAIPAGVWAALGAGLALLGMYLRGKRLEAELAHEKLKSHAATAAARSAKNEGKAEVRLIEAAKHEARAQELQRSLKDVSTLAKKDRDRIESLPANRITSEYLKLAQKMKEGPDV